MTSFASQSYIKGPRRSNSLPCLDLPSFVPHYEAPTGLGNLCKSFCNDPFYYDCGGNFLSIYLPNASEFESQQSLAISGCFRGQITRQFDATVIFDKCMSLRKRWTQFCISYIKFLEPLAPETRLETSDRALNGWKALVADIYLPNSSIPWSLVPTSVRMRTNKQAETLFHLHLLEAIVSSHAPSVFLSEITSNLAANILYMTDKGEVVKAPNAGSLKPGDQIFVARGCSCALILRNFPKEKLRRYIAEASLGECTARQFVLGAYV